MKEFIIFMRDGRIEIGNQYPGGCHLEEGTWIWSRKYDNWYLILRHTAVLRLCEEVPDPIRAAHLLLT